MTHLKQFILYPHWPITVNPIRKGFAIVDFFIFFTAIAFFTKRLCIPDITRATFVHRFDMIQGQFFKRQFLVTFQATEVVELAKIEPLVGRIRTACFVFAGGADCIPFLFALPPFFGLVVFFVSFPSFFGLFVFFLNFPSLFGLLVFFLSLPSPFGLLVFFVASFTIPSKPILRPFILAEILNRLGFSTSATSLFKSAFLPKHFGVLCNIKGPLLQNLVGRQSHQFCLNKGPV